MSRRPVRIAVLSDLHLDVRRKFLQRAGASEMECATAMERLGEAARDSAAGADLVVLAGDIADGASGIRWAAEVFPDRPVVYVAGNHEFYRHDHAALLDALGRAAAATPNVAFLEHRGIALEPRGRPLRVLGCTAWTDYRLYGGERAPQAMRQARERMYDHQRIGFGPGAVFQPEDALALHGRARTWLARELAKPFDGETIVVTHHAPSDRSIEPRFQGDALSPAFASDLAALMARHEPALWVHGHTHHNVDYRIGATRVVSNQWGYPSETPSPGPAIVEV